MSRTIERICYASFQGKLRGSTGKTHQLEASKNETRGEGPPKSKIIMTKLCKCRSIKWIICTRNTNVELPSKNVPRRFGNGPKKDYVQVQNTRSAPLWSCARVPCPYLPIRDWSRCQETEPNCISFILSKPVLCQTISTSIFQHIITMVEEFFQFWSSEMVYNDQFQLRFFSISSPWLKNFFNFKVLKWCRMTNFNFYFSAYHHHGWRIFPILKFWNSLERPISTSIFQHIITMVEEIFQFWSSERV